MAQKDIKMRNNNTYARSNVIGNDDDAARDRDGNIHGAQNVNRDNKNWQSTVFAGPKMEQSNRVRLGKGDKGRDGLFGNTMDDDAYAKKTSLAGAISQKEGTRAPVFDQSADFERKNRELWGNSNY